MHIQNLVKENAKVEVLVHSDLEESKKWIKIFSKSGVKKNDDVMLDGKFIPCNQALKN